MKANVIALFAGLVFTTSAWAQEQQHEYTEAEQYARDRASAYADALGLDAKATQRLVEVYMKAEEEVAPLREQCAAIEAKVEAAMVPYDAKAEAALSKEQRAKLETMKKEGKWTAPAACGPKGMAMKECGDHGAQGAKGTEGAHGCCAGKAGASAAAPATPATPARSATPAKRMPTPTADPDPK